jgi:hypothetical protein
MSQFILDANSLEKLPMLTNPVELCDPSGRILGRFVPKIDLSEWEIVGQELNDEELRKREESGQKRYTTAEVIAHLESLK